MSPDDRCLVCDTTRENHGDKRHKFNDVDDQLYPLDPPPKPRAEAPRERGETPAPAVVAEMIKAESFATLMEVLVEKEILDAKDVIRVFTGKG
jgi:hypothetical protein